MTSYTLARYCEINKNKMRDFTIKKYRKLCNTIKENYGTLTFEGYLTKSKNKFVILRHDVDRMP
ncbi:MAG: hypothetical protein CVT89_05530, partial [Candidatus Altiarchaeales archaeon HGW-Altiarchaeales-2]